MVNQANDVLRRERIELKHCLAQLVDVIAQSDRWYARREADLVAFDRRAHDHVARLRTDGRVQASMAWDPARVA